MTALWTEIKKAVQFYTNPFFASVEVLKECLDVAVIKNRLQLMEAMNDLMVEYTIHNEAFLFKLVTADGKEVDFHRLLPQVVPMLGDEFVQNGDLLTFECVKKQTDAEFFQLAGLFFQEILLYGIAGFDKRTMYEANEANRQSLLEVLGQIFRLPGDIGLVHLRVVGLRSGRRKVVQPQELRSGHGHRLYQYLAASKPLLLPPAQPNASNTSSSEAVLQQSESDTYQLRSSRSNSLTPSASASANKGTRSATAAQCQRTESAENGAENGTRKRPLDLSSPVSAWPSEELANTNSRPRPSRSGGSRDWSPLPTGTALIPTPHRPKSPFSPPAALVADLTYSKSQSPSQSPSSHRRHKWVKEHPLVGTRVAAERSLPSHLPSHSAAHSAPHRSTNGASLLQRVVCKGTVLAFAPTHGQVGTSTESRGTFRVKWSDPRLAKEELSLQEVTEGSRMYDEIEGWTVDNPSVGQRIAGIFPHQQRTPTHTRGLIVPLNCVEDVYVGRVVKYQHPSAPQKGDQLYHVRWCDGDVEDYDQGQLQDAQMLYITHRSKFSAQV